MFLLIILPISIIYATYISELIEKNTDLILVNNWKKIIINVLKIIAYTIPTILFTIYLLIYHRTTLTTKSGFCTNIGSLSYFCKSSLQSMSLLLLVEVIIVIHHF